MNWRALGLAMVLLVAACGGGGASNPTPSAQAIPFTLNAVNNNGVSGDGTITKMSGKFTVTLRLKGLVANSSHMAHIHKGSCAPASQGDIVTVLENVKADGAGSGTATTSIPRPCQRRIAPAHARDLPKVPVPLLFRGRDHGRHGDLE